MKSIVTILLSVVFCLELTAQNYKISGKVFDEKKVPIAYANIYIDETLDGTSTNDSGMFEFTTTQTGSVTLKASFIGYNTYSITKSVAELRDLTIILKPTAKLIEDVVVIAGNYALKSSTLENQNAVGLITTAGSGGDLYKSLTLLPGAQVPETDGRMLVRGGESRESQTFIDGMHVLSPYTANTPGDAARSQYSPFHFEGINFSTGGYSPEYSQSLSSILPLDTKDENKVSKYGFQIMNVNMEVGGTKAWEKASASTTVSYTDITFYNATLYPGENDKWDIPYRNFATRNQLRFNIDKNTTLKTYYTYDKTRFRQQWEDAFGLNPRKIDFEEDNLYLNTTLKKKYANNVRFFIGSVYGWNRKNIGNSLVNNDNFYTNEQELHLKTKASKRFTNLYKLEAGAETYLRSYRMKYADMNTVNRKLNNNISGLFLSNDFNFTTNFFLNLSGRVEYTSLTDSYAFLPRLALNYQYKDFTVSAITGKYQQSTDNNYLVYNERLAAETNSMAMLGVYYNKKKRIYRAEVYHKKYNNLPLLADGIYTSDGYGYSRGIDLYFDDRASIKNVEYMIAYSYNDSKRKYLHYPEEARPTFTTRHNAAVTLKYTFGRKILSILGVTNQFAGGRPYHNPNKEGFMNDETPLYHTLDLSLTVLPHPKVIVYACLLNVLNRSNIYGYTFTDVPDVNGKFAAAPTRQYQQRAFYIGVFITLGKNVAYEATYF